MYSSAMYGKDAPVGIGAKLKGWDISEGHYRDSDRLPIVDFRAFGAQCPHACPKCFTFRGKRTLSTDEIKNIIDQLKDLDTYAINYVGEGEPTIDGDFFEIVNYTTDSGIIPVVFTEASVNLRDENFAKKLRQSGASTVIKVDSLYNRGIQGDAVGDRYGNYLVERNQAIDLLRSLGFNDKNADGTTRLGFDMVVTKENISEVGGILDYARENNIWTVFAYHLPTGLGANSDMIDVDEKAKLADKVASTDRYKFDFKHNEYNNFLTQGCVEFMQIFGDGRVSPCPGNDTIIGSVRESSIKELKDRIVEKFPKHDRKNFDGNCIYRDDI